MSMPLVMFLIFIAITVGITYWASKRSAGSSAYFAASRRVTGWQNGIAVADSRSLARRSDIAVAGRKDHLAIRHVPTHKLNHKSASMGRVLCDAPCRTVSRALRSVNSYGS
jgi:hypothetical protein